MNTEIANYLEGDCDYAEGLQLLQAANPEHPHIRLIAKGFNLTNQRRLTKALESCLSATAPEIKKTPIKPKPLVTQKQPAPQHVDSSTQERLLDLKTKKSKLFSNASYYHKELVLTPLSQKERELRCRLIVESFNELREVWSEIDYFTEFGHLPLKNSNDAAEVQKAVEAQKRINNLRSYLTKDRKALASAKTEKTRNKLQDRINRNQFELENLLRAY